MRGSWTLLAVAAVVLAGAPGAVGAPKASYVLSVSVKGHGKVTSKDGQITCPGSCSGKYAEKTTVALEATPDSGYQLVDWNGCDSQSATSCDVAMTKDRSVGATFDLPKAPQTYTLTVAVTGPGKVTSKDGQINCPGSCTAAYAAQTQVSLDATGTVRGATLNSWKGCDSTQSTTCLFTITADRLIQVLFDPPPPPPEIQIVGPPAGTFYNRTTDVQVTVRVTVHSQPTFFCFSVDDATDLPPDCNILTTHGLGAGTYTRQPPGLHTGRNTVTAWALDSAGQTATDSRDVEVASPTSGIDLRTVAIEPTQGIQFWGLANTQIAPGGSRSGVYNGVRLATGGRTVVRVYANVVSLGRASSIVGARMQLFGYQEGSGRLLAGAPLLPVYSPYSLRLGPDEVSAAQRLGAGAAYTFDLPESWTHGTIRLLASLNALGSSPSIAECSACYPNNSYLLTGVRFYDHDPVTITPLEVVYRASAGAPATRPLPVGQAFADAINLVPFQVRLYPYRSTVDVTSAYMADPTLSNRSRDEWAVLDAISNMFDVIPRDGDGIGVSRGWIQGLTGWYVRFGKLASVTSNRPYTSVMHEWGHILGFEHASTCHRGTEDVGTTDDWPPDQRGYIQGVGLDRRPGSGGSLGPYRMIGDGTWYDIMGYCANPNTDADSWLSSRNWQRLMGGPLAQTDREATTRQLASWQAVGPTLHVVARVDGGKVEVMRVEPGRGTRQTQSKPGAPYRVLLLDASGRTISSTGVAPQEVHIDHLPMDKTAIVADVPASRAVTEVRIVAGGATKASRKASAHAPTVAIVSPKAGETVGRVGTVTVRWAAADADGGPLSATLEYSRNGGATWTGVGSTSAHELTLPGGLLSASRAARVRVIVNDGFHDATAVSGVFTAVGTPPAVTIFRPGPRVDTVPADAMVGLSGQAFDDTPSLLPGSALSWFDGKHLLGHGATLSVLLLPGRRTIRLVARDRLGRTGSASAVVNVRPVAPFFLKLLAPKKISPAARSVALTVSSSIAARLRAGGRSFLLDRRVRRITVAVKPGRGTLVLPLALGAGSKTTRVRLSIAR